MFLFGRDKLNIRSKEEEDGVNTFIEYHGIEQKDVFKVKVLNELIGDDLCLGVLDSRLLYCGPQEKSNITFGEIIEYLDFTRVPYKKIEIKKVPEISMFGLTVKKGSKKIDREYIVGFVVNKDNLKRIEEHINKLNIYYFIEKTGLDEDVLFQKLLENYEDLDEMSKDFYYRIFDNNFGNHLVILSESEQALKIKEIINRCYSGLK